MDSTHSAATTFNLQSSPAGAYVWTMVANVTSPHVLSGLPGGTAIDVQIQSANAAGTSPWSATTTLTTGTAIPNAPAAPSLAQGPGSGLTVTWTAPTVDSTHSAATAFNLQSSPSGANAWTQASNVTSPYVLSGLAAGAAIDVQIQGANVAGTSAWSASSTLTTASGPFAPNAPSITAVAPPPDGTNTKLTVTWTAPATDSTHGAATGYNLRYSPSGAGTWTTVPSVTSPYTIAGLTGATAIDVEVQATNAAAGPSAWSAVATGTTWGATVAPGGWTAAAAQVHGANVAPNGGVQITAAAAPTAVTGAAFAWSVEPVSTPHHQPDRGRYRRPDQRMGAVFHRTGDRRHVLSLDAGARLGRRHDRRPRFVGDHGVIAARPGANRPWSASAPSLRDAAWARCVLTPATRRAAAAPSRRRLRRSVRRPLRASVPAPPVRAPPR